MRALNSRRTYIRSIHSGILLLLSPKITSALTGSTPRSTALFPRQDSNSDSSFTSNSTFQTQVLAYQNWYRLQHNTSLLTWNETLAISSAQWADQCIWAHSHDPGVGENLAIGYKDITDSVDAWGLERMNYNWSDPGFSESTGHFTQLVWKDSSEVGCARNECPPGFPNANLTNWFVVCQYQPPGNEIGFPGGSFARNVAKQIIGSPDIGVGGSPNGRITILPPSNITPDSTGSSGAGKQKGGVSKVVLGTVVALVLGFEGFCV